MQVPAKPRMVGGLQLLLAARSVGRELRQLLCLEAYALSCVRELDVLRAEGGESIGQPARRLVTMVEDQLASCQDKLETRRRDVWRAVAQLHQRAIQLAGLIEDDEQAVRQCERLIRLRGATVFTA